jgi:D-aminopeptidase
VTVLDPGGNLFRSPVPAGGAVLNGAGECTGFLTASEWGVVETPVFLTSTMQLGRVYDAACSIAMQQHPDVAHEVVIPVVAECDDSFLNDCRSMQVDAHDVRASYDQALASRGSSSPPAEGAVGAGAGMTCFDFKGGIGTASRVLGGGEGGFTVGALVQTNHGRRPLLRVDGAPVGRVLGTDRIPSPYDRGAASPEAAGSGSIVVFLATDAPLLPHQCERLAQRAGIGVARAGGGVDDASGDLFLAFATGNHGLPRADYGRPAPLSVDLQMLPDARMSPLFEAAAEATEEAILNSLLAAGTMTGRDGITAHGLDGEVLLAALDELAGARRGR